MALGGDRAALLRRRGWLYIVADAADWRCTTSRRRFRLPPRRAMPTTAGASHGCAWASTARAWPTPKGHLLRRAHLATALQRRSRLCVRERRRRGRGPQEGSAGRGPGRPVSGPRRELAPPGAQTDAGGPTGHVLERCRQAADPAVRALRRRLSATDLGEPVASAAKMPLVPAAGSATP